MAWPEFRKTKNGVAKRRNKAGVMQIGMWYAIDRHPFTNKRMSESAGAKSEYAAARKRLEKRIDEIKEGKEAEEKPKTLFQVTELYRLHIGVALKKKTADAYLWAIKKLEDHFKNEKMLKAITPPEFLKFLDSLLADHNVNGIRDIAKACSAFFTFCIKRGHLKVNPAAGCLEEKVYAEVRTDKYYTDEEARTLIHYSLITRPKYNEEFRDIIKIALNTGLRQGEIPVIKISWIYNGYINLPWEMTKCDKPRKVPIHQKWLMPLLQKYIDRGQDMILPGWSTNRIQTAWRRSVAKAKKAKTISGRCRFHDLRHTFASNFLKDGGKIQDLQIILGHADIKTTMRYVHFQEDHTKEPVNNMKNFFMEEAPLKLAVI